MITHITSGGIFVDAEALYIHFGETFAIQTIRARCQIVGEDRPSGRKLYNLEDAEEAMAGVVPRKRHSRRKRSVAP